MFTMKMCRKIEDEMYFMLFDDYIRDSELIMMCTEVNDDRSNNSEVTAYQLSIMKLILMNSEKDEGNHEDYLLYLTI